MLPKHNNPTSEGRTAKAPYNFVPLPDRPFTAADGQSILNPDQGVYDAEKRLTGWIDVQLETHAPLYVRGPLTPDDHKTKEHQEADPNDRTPHLKKLRNKPDFFHTGDPNAPVIPGSSLRGMIRTICEILGHGKFSPVPDRPLVYRAVGDMSSHGEEYRKLLMDEEPGKKNWFTPKYRGGFIRRRSDGWWIQPASQTPDGATFARIMHKQIPERRMMERVPGTRNAYFLHVVVGPNKPQEVRGGFVHITRPMVTRVSLTPEPGLMMPAVLAESGPIPKKASEAVVFQPDFDAEPDDTWIRIPDGSGGGPDVVTEYLDQVTTAQERLLGGRDGVLRDCQPVFYLVDRAGNLFFSGHTQMFRLPYRRSPKGFLPAPFTDEGRIDLAESMFGKVRGEIGGQAGRVFVGDARLEPNQGDPWLPGGEVIPKILSTPKPTTFQHYLTQPRPDVPDGKGIETYNSSPDTTTLRGYKLYWHKGNPRRVDIEERRENLKDPDKETQHTYIKPVRPDLKFKFRVRFENLLPQELGLLWWALALPAEGNKEYCHKLGMGKPYGLGAVRLRPSITLVDPKGRYENLLDGDGWATGELSVTRTAERLDLSVDQFQKFIAKSQGQEGVEFTNLERVRMLLAMLEFPGPNPDNTRYMEIEHWVSGRKTNEYRGRPVLPDPLKVR